METPAAGPGGKGKRSVLMIGALGLVALAGSAFVFKDPVIERVCLWKLASDSAEERRAAGEWLSRKGSVRAIPGLMQLINEPRKTVVSTPIEGWEVTVVHLPEEAAALESILARNPFSAVRVLVRALGDRDVRIRRFAASLVLRTGPASPLAVKDLFKASCRDDDEIVRYRAGLSLKEIGRPAVPFLTAALQDPDPGARAQAAWLLGRIGAEAEEALPALVDLSRDADEKVRREAEAALRRIGASPE